MTDVVAVIERRFGGVRSLDQAEPLEQIIMILLADGSSSKKASQAMDALRLHFVDWNEVRVSSVAEVASVIEAVGPKRIEEKAKKLRDFLATVYSRFNRMSLAFLTDVNDKLAPRKTERLFAYLNEHLAPAYVALLECYVAGREPVVQMSGGLPRVLTRLGWMKKGVTPAQAKKKIEDEVPVEDRTVFIWGMHQLAETVCDRQAPLCADCVLRDSCETAPEEIARADAARKKEDDRLEREAAKETARLEREDRERKKLEAAAKKKEEAERAKVEREQAAKKKLEDTAKKKEAERAEAAAREAAKKAAAKAKTAPKALESKKPAKKAAKAVKEKKPVKSKAPAKAEKSAKKSAKKKG